MTVWQALLLGIVQGLTEFLPVSSKGHLALASMTLGLENNLAFDVFLHFATLAAIIWFFRSTLQKLTLRQWGFLMVATVPLGLVGILIEQRLESWLQMPLLIMSGLLVTAGLNFFAQWKLARMGKVTAPFNSVFVFERKKLLLVGLAQALALLPGISRSGVTLASGLAVGLPKPVAFDWAFLLAIPAVLAASLYQGWQVYSTPQDLPSLLPMTVGFIGAFLVGLLSLTLLKYVLYKDEFWIFGVYCVGLAALVYWVGVR